MDLKEAIAAIPETDRVAVMPKPSAPTARALQRIIDEDSEGLEDKLKVHGLDPATATLWDKAYVILGYDIAGEIATSYLGVVIGQRLSIEENFLLIATRSGGKMMPLDEIDSIRVLPPPPPPKSIDEQVKEIPIGKYTLIWLRKKSAGGNPLAEQGKLKSVDEKKRSLELASTAYPGQTYTVAFDNIEEIDLSRERSGALGPAQTPDLRFVGGGIGGGVWMRGSEIVQGGGGRLPDGTDVSDPLKPLGF